MGEVFAGRYELVDPIGRGGVGAVWRAWDHRRRRYVAAKVLQQSDAHSLLRFVREQALRIDHPHVLAPASWAADDDQVLFTMDLIGGGSLVHLVGDYGPLPPAFVCTLLDQLLSGLAAVHAEGVVHRDIKPANVLLEATGTARPRLRLSDFGIAVRLGEPRLTVTNLVMGTPGYFAPEQMTGSEPAFPADLFAVGLVALYLLEGARPDAQALVRYFTEHGTPGAPRNIPEPLWEVVATLLQPDPDARFRTATGARKALASAAELLPEAGPDEEIIEIFDHIGPLPPGFAPDGPLRRAPGVAVPGAAEPSAPSAVSPSTGGPPRSPDTGPGPAPAPSPAASAAGAPPGAEEAAPANLPPSVSDTGSFHLPPPQTTDTTATPPRPPASPRPPQGTPDETTHVLGGHLHRPAPPYAAPPPRLPHTPAGRPAPATGGATASYTAQASPGPRSPAPVPSPGRGHRAPRPRRPGPPAGVTVPVLLLALACYAVGFWALTRI